MSLIPDTEVAMEDIHSLLPEQSQETAVCPQAAPQSMGATAASRPAAGQFRAFRRSHMTAALSMPVVQAHSPVIPLRKEASFSSSSDADTPMPASRPCPCSTHQSVASSGSNNFNKPRLLVRKKSGLGESQFTMKSGASSSAVIGLDQEHDTPCDEMINKLARLKSPSKDITGGLSQLGTSTGSGLTIHDKHYPSLGSGRAAPPPAQGAVNNGVAAQVPAPQKASALMKRKLILPSTPVGRPSDIFSSGSFNALNAVPAPLSAPHSAPAGFEQPHRKIPGQCHKSASDFEKAVIGLSQRSRSEPVLPSSLIRGAGMHLLAVSNRFISDREFKAYKSQQRQSSHHVYSSDFFFPSFDGRAKNARLLDEQKLSRMALARAPEFVCLNIHGCTKGDCLHGLQTSDVQKMRHEYMSKSASSSLKDVLHTELLLFYDRTTCVWNEVNVSLDASSSFKCCPISFCLLVGASASTAARVIQLVEDNMAPARKVLLPSRVLDRRTQVSLDWATLSSYVASLLSKHEADPAPGAHQPQRQTHISKMTWKQKWDSCCQYFRDADRVPGSKTMLKRVWRLEKRLKERRAKSHSKCSICSKIDADTQRLLGVNTDASRQQRDYLKRIFDEHEAWHLSARSVLDEAGLMSISDPRYIWTICVDAATQRNFELPKFQFRSPKNFAGRPFWSFKLMASYVYGDGFYPFLVHDAQKYGANLTWTVIWLTLTELYRKRGYWPSVIHIQLDNTKGENKNDIMLMVSAWLVASGKVKQVRVFFLPVGHTHIVIDHIFGIITIGLRRKELLLPRELMQNIDESMANNPQYNAKPTRWLHALWDFSNWAKQQIGVDPTLSRLFGGEVQDEDGTYTGMYDFIFNKCSTHMASLQYREHCSHSLRPATGPCRVIRSMPTGPPKLQEIKPAQEWAYFSTNYVLDTIILSLRFARSVFTVAGEQLVLDAWKAIIADVPTSICFLKQEYKLEFEFFDNTTLPRITTAGNTGTEEVDPDEASYEEWKRRFAGFRTSPMAIDPVLSSEQSNAEFQVAKNAYFATLGMHGPSIKQSSPVLMGKFVLVKPAGARSLRLGCVRSLGPMETPYSDNVTFTLLEYEHTPNDKVSGMFGTFKVKYTMTGSKRCESRMKCQRCEVVVFNAELKPVGKKDKVLSLDSLRCLAQSMPDEYPMPTTDNLPTTHITKPKAPQASVKRKPVQFAPVFSDSSGQEDSSEDDEEDEEENDEEFEDDGSEDDDDEPEEDEEDDEAKDSGDALGSSVSQAAESDNPGDVLAIVPPTLAGGTLVEKISVEDIKEGSLRFLFMGESSETEYTRMKYPIGLVFVRAIHGETLQAYWFQREGGRKDFDLNLKFQSYAKWWNDPRWLKKLKLKRNQSPTTDQIFANWFTSPVDIETVVSVEIPAALYNPPKVVQNDRLRLPTEFFTDILLPVCKASK